MERREFLLLSAALLAGCSSQGTQPGPAAPGMKFSEGERQAITAYYARQRARHPPRELPAQRVKPGDRLEAGQRPNKLESALAQQLPDLPAPYTRLTLGGDVILVNRDTHEILDVIPQVAY